MKVIQNLTVVTRISNDISNVKQITPSVRYLDVYLVCVSIDTGRKIDSQLPANIKYPIASNLHTQRITNDTSLRHEDTYQLLSNRIHK